MNNNQFNLNYMQQMQLNQNNSNSTIQHQLGLHDFKFNQNPSGSLNMNQQSIQRSDKSNSGGFESTPQDNVNSSNSGKV